MKIEKQVCTFQQAVILRNLGVIQTGYWYWVDPHVPSICFLPTNQWDNKDEVFNTFYYSAFTVAELGAMFGKGTTASQGHWQWLINCVNSGLSGTVAYNAVALAGAVITQIQIGNLTVEEINERLK